MSQLFDVDTEPKPQPLPAHLRRLVLIVEDDPDQLELLEYRLRQLQYEVLKLDSGKQVFETAKSNLPDLIILDVQLPDASGLELCTQLADDPATATVPVVIVSGTDEPEIVREARKAGCRYFLRKPYDPNTLVLIAEHAIREADRWLD